MGSSGGGDSETSIRYAPYIESAHQSFLSRVAAQSNAAIASNPYSGLDDIPVDVGFFGTGYALSSFPSVYDMYGKFVAGLNIEAIWNELFTDTMENGQISALVTAHSAQLQDDIVTEALPTFEAGMRDIGAVNSSSFVVGRALIQDSKNKSVAKFTAELKFKLLPLIQSRFQDHLGWNQQVIGTYLNLAKHYFTIKHDITSLNYGLKDNKGRWAMEILDYERAALGALQGATKSKTSGGGASDGQKALGGALSGAAAGASFGPWGAAIGAVVGGIAGYLM